MGDERMRKKLLITINFLVIAFLVFIIYQQHQKINDYRSMLYSDLTVLNIPIDRILKYHENMQYVDDENQTLLNSLIENYENIFNHTGGGLQYEPSIRDKYFNYYNETKLTYTHEIIEYKDAKTEVERDEAYDAIKSSFRNYSEFLYGARKELER